MIDLFGTAALLAEAKRQTKELQAMRRLLFRQSRPGAFTVTLLSERSFEDMDILTYSVKFPTVPEGTDVKSQVFQVSVDGNLVLQSTLPPDAVDTQIEVPQDTTVLLSMVHIDDAGNESLPSTQEFVAHDTIAPDAPGAFGEITLIGERSVPDEEPIPDEPVEE